MKSKLYLFIGLFCLFLFPAQVMAEEPRIENLFAGLALFSSFMMLMGFALFILFIVFLIDVCRSDFRDTNKMVWVVMLIFIPPIGVPMYFFVGRKQKIQKQKIQKATRHYLNRDEEPDFIKNK